MFDRITKDRINSLSSLLQSKGHSNSIIRNENHRKESLPIKLGRLSEHESSNSTKNIGFISQLIKRVQDLKSNKKVIHLNNSNVLKYLSTLQVMRCVTSDYLLHELLTLIEEESNAINGSTFVPKYYGTNIDIHLPSLSLTFVIHSIFDHLSDTLLIHYATVRKILNRWMHPISKDVKNCQKIFSLSLKYQEEFKVYFNNDLSTTYDIADYIVMITDLVTLQFCFNTCPDYMSSSPKHDGLSKHCSFKALKMSLSFNPINSIIVGRDKIKYSDDQIGL